MMDEDGPALEELIADPLADLGAVERAELTVKERQHRLPDALVWHLLTQICHGLKKVHDAGLVHRALKTRNLLLFPEHLYAHPYLKYRCKLTDLAIPELQRQQRVCIAVDKCSRK